MLLSALLNALSIIKDHFMRRIIVLATLAIVISASQVGWAKNGFSKVTGLQLQSDCTIALNVLEGKYNPNNSEEMVKAVSKMTSCTSYLAAVNDTLFLMAGISSGIIENRDANIKMPYCIPDNLEVEDTIKVVLKYLSENPHALSVHAPIVIYAALKKYYPCSQKQDQIFP